MSGPMLAATICRTLSAEHEPLAKRITLNGEDGYAVQGYGKAVMFTFAPFECTDIVSFGRKLFTLSKDPAAGVLRGETLPHLRPGGSYYRRFKHPDAATNSLKDVPRSWIAIDCDDIPAPEALSNWLSDIPSAARHLVQMLPEELHDVTAIAQVTGSGGFTGDGLLRLRLWFALERAFNCLVARTWAQQWNKVQGTRLIDWSIFTPVALNYIADPILGPGVKSPVAGRWCLVRGRRDRATLTLPAEPEPTIREPSITTAVSVDAVNGSVSTRRRGFSELVGLIGSVQFGFYQPILAALGRAAVDGQDREATIRAVSAAVMQADPGHRDRATILRYASRGFLVPAFNSFTRRDARLRRDNQALHQHWFRHSPSTAPTNDARGTPQ